MHFLFLQRVIFMIPTGQILSLPSRLLSHAGLSAIITYSNYCTYKLNINLTYFRDSVNTIYYLIIITIVTLPVPVSRQSYCNIPNPANFGVE